MKKILGLDLGTNSIGWAVVNTDETAREDGSTTLQPTGISAAGSRIIPISADILGEFDKGNSVSQTAERTSKRMARRIRERNILRRERLLRVLKLAGFLPTHFAEQIDRYGKFIGDDEPKLAWKKNDEGKFEFVFQDSFNEMLRDFAAEQNGLVVSGKKIPYDWTIYYLRKKALTQAISKEELAWILLQFNQKRGYYQLRGEEQEEQPDKKVEYLAQKVVAVEATDEKKGDEVWYNVHLENGMVYRRTSRIPLDWVGKEKEFIVTTDFEKDGTPKKDKDGNIKRSFRMPKDDDWTLLKKKTEHDINASQKTIGCYIYDSLLKNPDQKIIGKLVRTVERNFYKKELAQILEVQAELIPELKDADLYRACVEELYPNNAAHRNTIAKPNFANLFINDILFYQRPLKSKKSLIRDCPYEFYKDKDGNVHTVKCIAKSNPWFQEFRLWQFLHNLNIYALDDDNPKSAQLSIWASPRINVNERLDELFDYLNDKEKISQDTVLKFFKADSKKYRWNYPEDKEYPGNETRAQIIKCLKNANLDINTLDKQTEYALWHLLYSISDKAELNKALKSFAKKHGFDEDTFAESFIKAKPFKNDYGSYSEKAIKKLLPLMRAGKHWHGNDIAPDLRTRIDKIINGEYDETIKDRVRDKAFKLDDISKFQGLPTWLACYIVYDRHSESKETDKWTSPDDIDTYLRGFKQHSLRNPIVEQVITETLRTVRDIWRQEGNIDEIHIELGREMKNPADKRKAMSERIQQNENTNLRIKALLTEFKELGIENVRPYSPSQQDILRIYEENALDNLTKDDEEYEFVTKMSRTAQPTKSEITRYKLWLEQKYRSPYTGEIIPLARLFTDDYQIEHVIPQARYFDDSFSNKVICEAEVNQLKNKQLGHEFIKNHGGQIVQLSQGKTVTIYKENDYIKFVKEHYAGNRTKMKKLLLEDIPDDFIERQLNDSRYISKVVKSLLSNIVREQLPNGEYEEEAVSKNLISCNGAITDRLKKDWGINDIWNSIILPRFRRLNELTGKDVFTTNSAEGHEIPSMPLELQKGFNKKRIDHRHHAMDAIVIACTTRDHVNLLNNEAAHSKHNSNRYQLQRKLRRFEVATMSDGKEKEVAKEFLKPWNNFTADVKAALEGIVVSFKQNLRVINKTVNIYQHYKNGEKVLDRQEHGDSWAIRKSMHKDTVFGEVNLFRIKEVSMSEALKKPERIVNKDLKKKVKELMKAGRDAKYIKKYVEDNKDVWADVNIKKIAVYYFTNETNDRYFATRKPLDTSFNEKKIRESVTDTGIQKILLAHLSAKEGSAELAFSPDGIDEMNRNIASLNDGKAHKPILKVRVYEKAEKFAVGQKGNKRAKFVEADKGTNLFYAFFKSGEKRSYLTIPLNVIIDCQKKHKNAWRDNLHGYLKDLDYKVAADGELLFVLSPNDLVYLPKEGETGIDKKRIYKFVSCTGNQGFFVMENVAKAIVDKVEFSPLNKAERAITGEMIKETCVPLKVDRLGNIIKVGI